MKDLFAEVDESYSIISAVGINIGVDIGIIAKWEEVVSSTVESIYTSYSTNSICTLVKRDDVDSINPAVCQEFLTS